MPSATLQARRATPQADYRLVSIEDLSGGLDQRKSATLIKPNRARILRNWSLREPGALSVYPGWGTFSTTNLGSKRPQGGQRVYFGSGTPFFLGAWNGGVYKKTDAGVWGAAVSTGWATDQEIFFPYDRDLVAILDRTTAAKKSTNGTTWTKFGISTPASAPTSANLAGGTLVNGNQYEFSYTGRDDELLHEGNESTRVLHTPAGANLSVRLTLTNHGDTQVDTLVIYGRDVTAGETVRRKIGTVANPAVTGTYDVTSNSWSAGTEAPSDHNVPELMRFAVVWKNRWWGADAAVGNRVRFTQIFENQSWPADFTIDMPFEKGDDIAAILPLGDTLLIFGQSKIFLIIGQTSLDFEVRPAGASQAGALGPRAVDSLEEGAVHAAAEGIYLFDGATDRLLSYDVDGFAPSAIGWRTYVTSASASDLAKTPLVYHQASKEIAIGVTNLYPFGEPGEWILDLNRTRTQSVPAWTTTNRAIGGYVQMAGNEPTTGNRGRIFSWSQTVGTWSEERTGTDADGADIVAEYSGPVVSTAPYIATFPDGYISFEPNDGTLGVDLIVDGTAMGSQNVNISGGGPVFGVAQFGTAVLGGPARAQKPLVFPLEAEGLTFQVQITYTGQAPFRLFTYGIGAVRESSPSGI